MQYPHIYKGTFIQRTNRFLADIKINDTVVICHVKNTGRCKELLIPGVSCLLQYHPDAKRLGRKTEYSLIGVYKGEILVNMDSQVPNAIAYEWLANGGLGEKVMDIRREVTYKHSRFDLAFTFEGIPAFMEIKGVTLEEDKTALFPDAPTLRGVKHLQELTDAARNGYKAFVMFVIQMKGVYNFTPNSRTHPAFAEALRDARTAGVQILAYDCLVTEDSIDIDSAVPVVL